MKSETPDAARATDSPITSQMTMRAIVQDKYGEDAADVLRLAEIDRPQVGEDDVLVRVHAASVHIGDWHVMTGLPYLLRVVGSDSAHPRSVSVAWMSPAQSRPWAPM
jgi:hypothetical protein